MWIKSNSNNIVYNFAAIFIFGEIIMQLNPGLTYIIVCLSGIEKNLFYL